MDRMLAEEELEQLVAACDGRFQGYAETWRRVTVCCAALGARPPSYHRVRRAVQRHRRLQEHVRKQRERLARDVLLGRLPLPW
jgi:hypothetical protein